MDKLFLDALVWAKVVFEPQFMTKSAYGKSVFFYDGKTYDATVTIRNEPTVDNQDVIHAQCDIDLGFDLVDKFGDLVRLTEADKLFLDMLRWKATLQLRELFDEEV